MNIRSITCFYDPSAARASYTLDHLARLAKSLRERFEAEGVQVQTLRLATVPFPLMVPSCCDVSAVELVRVMEGAAHARGFDYLSLGPALPEFPQSYQLIPHMLKETKNCFFSGVMADSSGVYLEAVRACGQVIAETGPLEPNGFANLRFAALANVPAGAPFFPAAYHQTGQGPAFSLAIEAADRVQLAFQQSSSLAEARERLLDDLNQQAELLNRIAAEVAEKEDITFLGIDLSPAPHPDSDRSLGAALEMLGVPALGKHGSLAAAAFLANALDDGSWRHIGFNGLMLPVLEDSLLAGRTATGVLTVRDLLLYSAVCGTGLDTVPLPGDSSPEQLSALLLDLATLAVRLNKPLTARLMPIPGKRAGDPTSFEFDYFANGRVMALEARHLTGLLNGNEKLELHPRRPAV